VVNIPKKWEKMEQSMLTGEYINKMDEKGRIMIPAKLRSALNSTKVVLTKSLDNAKCVSLFIPEDFERTINSVFMADGGLPLFNQKVMRLQRHFISTAQYLDFDGAGRILLPQSLRSYTGISPKDEVMVIGVTNHIEIWNKAEYEAYSDADVDYEELAEELSRTRRGQ